VNRVREALNDNAGTPQYVETVPRRGYRFIAPVAAIPQTESLTPAPPVSPVSAGAPPQSHRPPSRKVIAAAIASVLAAIGITTVMWLRQPRKPAVQEAKLITSSGWWPALSRDGKLLAYTSNAGGVAPHIWVRQTAGGEAIPVTTGSDPEAMPDFSPDATRIAFYSGRKGGGIYIAPTLPGEPRLLVATPDAEAPRFSPSGDTILYFRDQKAFTVPVNGGQPVTLPLNQDFRVFGPPLWGPSGDEILFYGVRSREQNKPAVWWIAPLAPGQARPVHLPRIDQNDWPAYAVRAWHRTADGREWIIFSTIKPGSWKLWRIQISTQGAAEESLELLASGNGKIGPGGSPSEDGKLAYDLSASSVSIYQISMDDRGQKLGPTFQLPLPEGAIYSSPSVSRDGRWMAYDASIPRMANTVLLRDLRTGADHLLDDTGRQASENRDTSISPDGSTVVFQRDDNEDRFPEDPEHPMPYGFMIAAAGGEPEQICERCAPRGFSSDGSLLLLQKYDQADPKRDRIVAVDLRTRTERDFLSHPDKPLFHAFFSWDDRWVVFKKLQSSDLLRSPAQILIAPVRHGTAGGEAEWIAETDGRYSDDKPQFSADGNTVYFTSTRDGYLCIWAQRLDPVTKHPLGPPFAYEHFHNAQGRAAAFDQKRSDLSVARDKILVNLPEEHSDIWMIQMQ
jgi:eukaryotic-like serine/threonine-protein kinase